MKHTFLVEINFDGEVTEEEARKTLDGVLDRGYDDLMEQYSEDEDELSEDESFALLLKVEDISVTYSH
ncbi:MAG: hypothetical protein DWQ19_12980 [Crenarchaeota archaeon]|nr:MAG: hypothetical protein DWQ19_12980 [Thermoproteota archaeon]